MYTNHDPYRHPDGSLDFDRYRAEAAALRRQAMQDTSKLSAVFKVVVCVVLLLGAVAVAPTKQDAETTAIASAAKAKSATARPASRTALMPTPEQPSVY